MAAIIPLLGALLPTFEKLLDRIPDPNAREKAKAELEAKLVEASIASADQQTEINKVEAAHENIFVSGWRPALGWVCATAFAWNYIAFPVLSWFAALMGVLNPMKPVLDGNLMELTLGLLGLAALRSFDKLKGTAK